MHDSRILPSNSRRFASLAVSATLLSASACAGSKAEVGFDGTTVPVSMSSALHDEAGELVDSEDYRVVRHFETEEKKSWAILYTGVRFQKRLDFSEEVNAAVSKGEGEGVVNLEVSAKSCGINMVIPMILLPFWPGCVKVWVSGDVMTREGVSVAANDLEEGTWDESSPVPEVPAALSPDEMEETEETPEGEASPESVDGGAL